MGLLAYGLVALALIGALAGGLGAVHHSGVAEGRAEVTRAWEAQAAKSREIVLADRKRVEGLRGRLATDQARRLEDEKKRSTALMVSLESHIKASGAFAGCKLSTELLKDANEALKGTYPQRN